MKKFLIVLAAVVSSACGSLPKSAPPVVVYDFGPPAERLAPDRAWSSLALEVKSPPWFDSLNIDLIFNIPGQDEATNPGTTVFVQLPVNGHTHERT